MSSNTYRTALVTGASSGIGAAVVRKLRAEGMVVHALARDKDRLDALAQETGCLPHGVSVEETAALQSLIDTLEVDVLVNNAGQSRKGNILDNTQDDIDTLVNVNLRGVLQLTRLVLGGMVKRNAGHIVNISSVAGHYSFDTGNTTYHVTKAGVHSLSQQLRCDLFGTQVRVTEISPARVETEVYARYMGNSEEARKRYFDQYEALLPEDIANALSFAINSPPRMSVSFMEILPTMQVIGGWRFAAKKTEVSTDPIRS